MTPVVLLYYNPIAGVGRGGAAADSCGSALRAAGHAVTLVPSEVAEPVDALAAKLAGCDQLVVLGGDGAMRAVAAAAARTGTPVYHLPCGTENLFARHFGMDRSTTRLLAALAAGRTTRVDVGRIGDERFLLMVSVGFDAEVIHDLAAHRRGRIRHRSYLGPIRRQLVAYRPPRITARIDGRELVAGRRGLLVVANCPAYAVRLDPAPEASMTDGLLDVVFLPASSRRALVAWALRCRLGRPGRGAIRGRGREVEIDLDPPGRYQLDGDPPANRASVGQVRISLEAMSLPVLLP